MEIPILPHFVTAHDGKLAVTVKTGMMLIDTITNYTVQCGHLAGTFVYAFPDGELFINCC